LRWDWFDKTTYSGLWFFALPLEVVKNPDHVDEGRPVVLNDISKDDRSDLLGHKYGDTTYLYCAKELTRMLENINKVTKKKGKLIFWKRAV
jgi:hypothetical protein